MTRILLQLRGGLIGLCLLCTTLLTAQQKATTTPEALRALPEVSKVEVSDVRSTTSLIELQPTLAKSGQLTTKGEILIPSYFSLDQAKDEVRAEKTTTNRGNLEVTRYQRYHNGIKVEHDRYNVVTSAGSPRLITAEHYDLKKAINVRPTLSRDQALEIAKRYVGATQYAWEYIEDNYRRDVWSPAIAKQIYEETEAVKPGGELTIVDNYSTEATDLDLAWKFNIYAAEPLSRAYVYVNAHNGEIMLNDRIIKHASTPTNVQTRYAGSRDIMVDLQTNGTDPYNGLPLLDSRTGLPVLGPTYVLRDDSRGGGLETYDLNGVGGLPLSIPLLYTQAKAFTDDDLDWSLAEHKRGGEINEAENDDIAWDAHWGTQVVYDYWLDVHGRRSYDDNDIAIKSFLHFGVAYDNAFWNGTAMTYGDGSYQGGVNPDGTFAPLMSLDVCGHEIGHAICTFTADLVYAKESGAMNEGFSDIWGAAIEAYAFRSVDPSLENIMAPFGIGEQIDERDGGIKYPDAGWQALRYMDEPGKAGDPDTYGGANWVNPDCDPNLTNDQCGVHTNSGVLNKWFFLLTAGEDAANDLGNAYSVSGLGFEVSERIAYGTELLLTPNATFAEARAASIAFVRAMTESGGGTCGNYEQQVTNAWYGVGVGPEFTCTQVAEAGFTQEASFVGERVVGDNSCGASKIFEVEAAVVSTGKVALGGTATYGKDYRVLNSRYRVGNDGFAVHNFQIEILDDALIEDNETIVLNVPGSRHVVTLIDDDVPVTPGNTTVNVLFETMRSNSLPPNWSTTVMSGTANGWYGSANSGAYIGINLLSGGGVPSYDGLGDNDMILSSPLVDARGMHSLQLAFDWMAGGESDVPGLSGTDIEAVPFDYGNLAYSFDGETWTDFTEFDPFLGTLVTVNTGSFNEMLPDYLQGTQFYLGWRWRNDANASGPYSFSFENVVLDGQFPGIATTTMNSDLDIVGAETFTYLSDDGTEALATLFNRSGYNFGCTEMAILTSGTGKNRCSGGLFMDKTYRIRPTNVKTRSVEVTFYFSEEEIAGFENATGVSRDDIVVYQSPMYVCSGLFNDRTEGQFTFLETIDGGVAITTTVDNPEGYFSFGVEDNSFLNFSKVTDGGTAAEAVGLNVFPNPVQHQLNVNLSSVTNGDQLLTELIAPDGRLITDQRTGTNRIFDVRNLPAGVYLLRTQLDDGTTDVKRIIKN